MMMNRLLLTITLLFVGFGCNLFSGDGDEIVFAATEVGTPVGDKVSKGIGPTGGTLTSPDGKLTLTVPKGALTENNSFSIQPITNSSAAGIGLGYRLEPHDAKFATPLELSIRFDDNDLEGTVPEALELAYQDSAGAWHAPTASRLDMNTKTLTVSTTHFSDWLFLRQLAITPAKAKVLVGETVFIKIDACTNRNWYERINIFVRDRCSGQSTEGATWELKGAGSLARADRSSGAVYTAPPVKPSDNKVRVILDIEIKIRDRATGEVRIYPRTFESRITIIDRGYKATGKAGPVVFDGLICDLDAPFTVNGRHPMLNYPLEFVPSSPVSGTWSYSASVSVLKTSGNGTYTVSDSSPSHPPRIEITGTSTASIPVKTVTGGGPAFIYLEPNDGNECIQKE